MSEAASNLSAASNGGAEQPAKLAKRHPPTPGPSLGKDKPRQTFTGRLWMGLLVSVALMAVAWHRTFFEMWHRWFPAWTRVHEDLKHRLTEGDSYYSHGPLVPLACLVIAWLIYRRVGLPARRTTGASVVGWVIGGGALLLHLVSTYADVTFASGFALIGVLAGGLLVAGGWPLARAYWLPVVFLLFMVPLPMDWIAKLNFQLKFTAAGAANWLTNYMFRIPAVLDGAHVFLPPEADGSPKMLVVENVCGGLRSLISLICFASLFALICRVRGIFWRLFMLAMALPVAIGCNIVRITILNVTAHHYGVAAAGEGAFVHDMSGLAVFVLALVVLFGLEQVIVQTGKLLGRNWTDPQLLSYLKPLDGFAEQTPQLLRATTIGALALTTAISVWFMSTAADFNRTDLAQNAVEKSVQLGPVAYGSEDHKLDQATLTILQTDDYLFRRFHDDGRHAFDLLIVFSPNNRKGTHPPEVCLEATGNQVTSKQLITVRPEGMEPLEMRELITQSRYGQTYHLYTYKSGKSYTPVYFTQQMMIFVNGLMDRNAAGAQIRVTLPIRNDDVDAARELALESMEAFMPQIHRNLP